MYFIRNGQVISGGIIIAGSFAIANPIGMVIGTHVVLAGLDSITESIKSMSGDKQAIGFMKKSYMDSAEYLGFTRKQGLVAYYSVDAVTSAYGAVRLMLKPSARRLYLHIPSDFERRFKTMSKAALTLEFGKSLYKGQQHIILVKVKMDNLIIEIDDIKSSVF